MSECAKRDCPLQKRKTCKSHYGCFQVEAQNPALTKGLYDLCGACQRCGKRKWQLEALLRKDKNMTVEELKEKLKDVPDSYKISVEVHGVRRVADIFMVIEGRVLITD